MEKSSTTHVADDLQDLGVLRVVGAGLVADGHGAADLLGEVPGPLGGAGVGGDNHQIIVHDARAAHVFGEQGLGPQMVHRLLEEALDLSGVQVHEDDPIHARGLDAVRADPGPDGHPRLVHLVALGVGEVGDDGGDGVGGGALEGVDPEQQLRELVVGMAGDGLD